MNTKPNDKKVTSISMYPFSARLSKNKMPMYEALYYLRGLGDSLGLFKKKNNLLGKVLLRHV